MKPKAKKIYMTRFCVMLRKGQGVGSVLDMMRYDRACPYDQADICRLMDKDNERNVRLVMHSEFPGGPSLLRWESFGFKVFQVEPT